MPQTDPDHFLVRRKLSDSELAQAIRLDIEAELDAINLYQSHIDSTDNELARKVLAHIRDEEREHASLFWALLRHLDPEIAEEDGFAPLKLKLIERGADELEIQQAARMAEQKGATDSDSAPEKPSAPQVEQATVMPALTVGSLKPRR